MSTPAARLWDISAPVNPASPAFPGDTAYRQDWVARIAPGCPVNVGAVTLSPHIGTHADAPLHYDDEGQAAGLLDLQPYLGPCRVVRARGRGPLIGWGDLAHALPATGPLPERLLVRSYERLPVDRWDPDFRAFAPDLLERLADGGLRLIGIDSASVDPAASKTLPSHQVLRRRGLRVLENLCLDEVSEGDYELIALPLKWTLADASPVRAVLREWRPLP